MSGFNLPPGCTEAHIDALSDGYYDDSDEAEERRAADDLVELHNSVWTRPVYFQRGDVEVRVNRHHRRRLARIA
jgi:hypothetical protein